jgi:rSAM/selenodomain-associated transferase 2
LVAEFFLSGSTIAVVVPVLNEDAQALGQTLMSAQDADEIFVVDGGSDQSKLEAIQAVAKRFGAVLLSAPKGRASQMNAGGWCAESEWLFFLHADVQLPADWRQRFISSTDQNSLAHSYQWGRFDVRFRPVFGTFSKYFGWRVGMWVVAAFMNGRSRLTSISTGDQVQFIRRRCFGEMSGFPEQLLMEDIAFAKRALKQFGKPLNLSTPVRVSARRWHEHGFFTTIGLMWKLRWQYWRGANPRELYKAYYGKS